MGVMDMTERRRSSVINVIRRRLVTIFRDCQSEPIEVLSGLLMLVSGWWLLWPADTFATSVTYRGMGNETIWGLCLTVLGAWTLYATLHSYLPYRSWGMFLCACVFSFWAVRFWQGNPLTVGVPAYLILSAATGWAWIHIRWREHYARHGLLLPGHTETETR